MSRQAELRMIDRVQLFGTTILPFDIFGEPPALLVGDRIFVYDSTEHRQDIYVETRSITLDRAAIIS